jgi:hypothetical protein
MYNVHGERSGGYSAIAFVICAFLAGILPGQPPEPLSGSLAVAGWAATHHSTFLLGTWLNIPATAFFLWFLIALRAFLRQREALDEGLPTYALAAGITAAVFALAIAVFQGAIPLVSTADAGGLGGLYAAYVSTSAIAFAPLAVFLFASAHSMRRHASAPAGLAILGYLAALTAGVATFSMFVPSGAWSPVGLGTVLIGILPFAVWTIWTGLVIIREAGKSR